MIKSDGIRLLTIINKNFKKFSSSQLRYFELRSQMKSA